MTALRRRLGMLRDESGSVQTVFSMPPTSSQQAPTSAPPTSAAPPSPKAAVPALSFDDAALALLTAETR